MLLTVVVSVPRSDNARISWQPDTARHQDGWQVHVNACAGIVGSAVESLQKALARQGSLAHSSISWSQLPLNSGVCSLSITVHSVR